MQYAAVLAALVASVAAVPAGSSPTASAPAGCSTSYSGSFQVVVAAVGNSKRSNEIEKRQSAATNLVATLSGGVLKDSQGRTGEIVANNQFQFDNPIQANAIYTSGWSVCSNGTIALGGSTIFYQCLSGSFYNIYNINNAAQCSAVQLIAVGGSTTTVTGGASQASDGQVTAASAKSTALCQITDGQLQANTCVQTMATITQISDGQVQAPKVTQISDGQVQVPATTSAKTTSASSSSVTGRVLSQISDGQIQATTGSNSTIAASRTPSATAATTSVAIQSKNGAAFPTMKSEFLGLAVGVIALAAL